MILYSRPLKSDLKIAKNSKNLKKAVDKSLKVCYDIGTAIKQTGPWKLNNTDEQKTLNFFEDFFKKVLGKQTLEFGMRF